MARLPQPGGDNGNWGDILNDYLVQSHNSDGTLKDDSVGADQLQSESVAETTLTNAVQTKLNAPATIADGSITKTKLESSVQTSLDNADTALQSAPVESVNTQTGAVTLTKADVGLGNVDNTADSAKPVSTATQTALNLKLDTADLDAQTATRITTNGSSTQTALTAGYYGKAAPSYAGTRTRPFDTLTNIYGSTTARASVRRALGFALGNAHSSIVNMLIVGDSFSSGWKANNIGTDDWATMLIAQLREAGYPITGGWVPPANGQTPGDGRWVFTGTGTWQGRTTTVNNYIWNNSGAGNAGNIATFTSTSTGTVAEFAVFGNAGNNISWDLDNGAQTGTTTTSGASSVTFRQFTGLANTTHTIKLTTTTSAIWVCGARVRDTTGLSITNAAIYGSHTNDWLPTALSSAFYNPYNLAQNLMAGVPRLTLLALGGNDAIHAGYTPASMKSNLQTIINAYQTAGSTVTQRVYPYLTNSAITTYINAVQAPGVTWDNFLSNMYDVSDTYDTVMVDHSNTLGDSNTLVAQGLMFSDALHLLTPGQAAIARADHKAILNV